MNTINKEYNNNEIIYKQLSQEDNIKLNFDIFIGTKIKSDIYNFIINENDCYEFKKVSYIQALLSLFNEGLLNSVDHILRTNIINKNIIEKCNMINIYIDKSTNKITIINNGLGISKDDLKIIFVNLNSSSNYENRTYSSGKNGIGAKIIKILSSYFKITSVKNNIKSSLLFNNNNLIKEESKIIDSKDYTKLEYIVDFNYFENEQKYSEDIINIFKKRIFDTAIFLNKINELYNLNVKIYLNNNEVKTNLKLITSNLEGILINDYLFIGININENITSNSIINGTSVDSGTSINYYKNLIFKLIKEKIKNITFKMVNDKIYVINFNLISKPEFNSNLKNSLISKFEDNIDKKEFKSIINYLIEYFELNREKKTISKISNKEILLYENLVDAKYAGNKKYADSCYLIITEGMSARGNCLKGLEELDEKERNYYGVFSIVGKPKNLKKYSIKDLDENDIEYKLLKVLGIDNKNDKLRYGKVIYMTDQDVDGFHIRAILTNFFNEVKKVFLERNVLILKTPLISFKENGKYYDFFTEEEFNRFKLINKNIKKNNITYYKGIGTLKKEDIKRIFNNLKNNLCYLDINLKSKLNNEQSSPCEQSSLCKQSSPCEQMTDSSLKNNNEMVDILLNQMFGKDTKERKNWINRINKLNNIESNEVEYSIYDYLSGTILIYADEFNIRHIPIAYDGLKEVHRKILYISLMNENKIFKVSELGSEVSSKTDYHHGEMSMYESIINLSQNDIVGKGTLNLILIDGAIGSRREYGKDHAKPRYLFASLNNITKYIFLKEQKKLFEYKFDERGKEIEPKILFPLIPISLIYGFSGMGYGFASNVFLYNLFSIIDYLTNKSKNIKIEYLGFKGFINIKDDNINKIYITGIYNIVNSNHIKILEIPFSISGTAYKKYLTELVINENDLIKSFHINKIENSVDIDIYLNKSIENINLNQYNNSIDDFIIKKFKLRAILTQNLTFLDLNKSIIEFKTIYDYLDYFKINLLLNIKKLIKILIDDNNNQLLIIKNKINYIKYIKQEKIKLSSQFNEEELINILKINNFELINDSYDYLLLMPIKSLTIENIKILEKEYNKIKSILDKLINITEEEYYYEELFILRNELSKYFKLRNNNKNQ